MVVTFRPEHAVIKKILDYTRYVDFLIVADNTDTNDLSAAFYQQAGDKLEYIGMAGNEGIAKALNVGASRAIAKGYPWLLMLDQDSILSETTYRDLKRLAAVHGQANVGIISATPVSRTLEYSPGKSAPEIAEVDLLMTSGSMLSLHAYLACGGFEERLFIDHVDHEYCLRLQKAHYRTLQCSAIVLQHSLGELQERKVLGATVRYTEHKPFRLYYFVRNGLYVGVKFFSYRPRFLLWMLIEIGKQVIKAIFFQDQTILRLRMILWGLIDFLAGRHGAGQTVRARFPA